MNRDTITHISYQVGFACVPIPFSKDIRQNLIGALQKSLGVSSIFSNEESCGFEKKTGETETIRANFFPNQIMIVHDYPSELDTAKSFSELSRTIVLAAAEHGKIPVFLQQMYIVRACARPLRTDDARIFIGEHVLRLNGEKTSVFSRPIQSVGFRLIFPMGKNAPYGFDLRVQSSPEDSTTVILENQCQFGETLSPEQVREGEIERRLALTVEFLHENAVSFLEKFNDQEDNPN